MITYAWRGPFTNPELSALHAEGFGGQPRAHTQPRLCSFTWARQSCARDGAELAGFVNVAWDGNAHAFLLDTLVAARLRRQTVGTALVALAAGQARAAGCQWLHVDFEDHLRPFYFGGCGFKPTNAGLIAL